MQNSVNWQSPKHGTKLTEKDNLLVPKDQLTKKSFQLTHCINSVGKHTNLKSSVFKAAVTYQSNVIALIFIMAKINIQFTMKLVLIDSDTLDVEGS